MTRKARARSTPRSRRREALPSDGWLQRLVEGAPFGPVEALLARGARHRSTRAPRRRKRATGSKPNSPSPMARWCRRPPRRWQALEALQKPLAALGRRLEAVLEDAPDWLDGQARARVDGAIRGLAWRRETLAAWIALLARIGGAADPEFRRLARGRADRRARISTSRLHRRWLDPTRPLAATVLTPAHGVLVTSATLRGGEDWAAAEARTGAVHLAASGPAFRGRQPVRLRRPAPKC